VPHWGHTSASAAGCASKPGGEAEDGGVEVDDATEEEADDGGRDPWADAGAVIRIPQISHQSSVPDWCPFGHIGMMPAPPPPAAAGPGRAFGPWVAWVPGPSVIS
jgi:hypothetical protein